MLGTEKGALELFAAAGWVAGIEKAGNGTADAAGANGFLRGAPPKSGAGRPMAAGTDGLAPNPKLNPGFDGAAGAKAGERDAMAGEVMAGDTEMVEDVVDPASALFPGL